MVSFIVASTDRPTQMIQSLNVHQAPTDAPITDASTEAVSSTDATTTETPSVVGPTQPPATTAEPVSTTEVRAQVRLNEIVQLVRCHDPSPRSDTIWTYLMSPFTLLCLIVEAYTKYSLFPFN